MSRDLRTERQAHFVIGGGGAMSPYRIHSQAFRPAPARRVNFFRRLLRALIRSLT